ncbi:unnamed protein product [Cylicostephanus goldi]|uniref:Uncharacterized protein n=1 Tax=Cylicostephanus goldi TaxID=71465 RepID=A0A3P7NAM5_CYLGO|nr:unnamed protein product [Cylicostephanus goldi]
MFCVPELSLRELHERSIRQFRKKNFPDHPSKEEPEVLNIVEPKHRVVYHRDDLKNISFEDFTPTRRGRYSREQA